MATWTYETVNPTPIANAIVEKAYADGVHKVYRIGAIDGYVLHDSRLDAYENYDEEGNPVGEPILGYAVGTVTVRYDYDFVVNPTELYAVPRDSVPADQIFGGGDSDHEVM